MPNLHAFSRPDQHHCAALISISGRNAVIVARCICGRGGKGRGARAGETRGTLHAGRGEGSNPLAVTSAAQLLGSSDDPASRFPCGELVCRVWLNVAPKCMENQMGTGVMEGFTASILHSRLSKLSLCFEVPSILGAQQGFF